MTEKHRVIKVSRDQITAARALIILNGGPDNVTPLIRKIAGAGPASVIGSARAS